MKTCRLAFAGLFVFALCDFSVAQEYLLKKSWINVSIEEFRNIPQTPDTSYLRYLFQNTTVLLGFEPGWHYIEMPYSVKAKMLTLGVDQWTIETLTDSTLTIFLAGYRRMNFVSEDHLRMKDKYLVQVGEHKGKPLYQANRVVTPRYKRPYPLINDINKQDRSDDYNIRKAGNFLMSFIVTEDGKIEDPIILTSVAPGFDNGIISQLQKTSKKWYPAMFKGKPIQTLMMFEIKFLDSLGQQR